MNAFLRILNRRRDYVTAARPFAQIEGAAALAAKRELRRVTRHFLLADWTGELDGSPTRHICIVEDLVSRKEKAVCCRGYRIFATRS